MGWLGVVFKADIAGVSDYLAIGLTTGYLGSLTTFSGWNQKMLDLAVDGHWVFVVLGFLVGKNWHCQNNVAVALWAICLITSYSFEFQFYQAGLLLESIQTY